MEGKGQNVLISPGFLAGLLLLLLNDFVLKQTFHNWLTGKLSDFAGLFVFPIFWAAFFPNGKKYIYLAIGLCFALWKSVYAQPLILWWNMLPFFKIYRTIDYSDLIALSILPLSYYYVSHYRSDRIALRRIATIFVIIVSMFAFTATQMADEQRTSTLYGREYHYNASREYLVERLRNMDTLHLRRAEHLDTSWGPGFGEHYVITIRRKFCKSNLDVFVEIIEYENRSVIKLMWVEYRCDETRYEGELLSMFEDEVARKLPLASTGEGKRNQEK